MSKLRLFLIRHGETVWSRERRFAGSRDVPLAPEGLRQCEAVATTLASQIVATVYASPLERARASAEVIARPHRLPVVTEPAFREMAFGAWEGLTRGEVAARFPDDYERWRTTPHLLRITTRTRTEDNGITEQRHALPEHAPGFKLNGTARLVNNTY